jgi:hypothetical protein
MAGSRIKTEEPGWVHDSPPRLRSKELRCERRTKLKFEVIRREIIGGESHLAPLFHDGQRGSNDRKTWQIQAS